MHRFIKIDGVHNFRDFGNYQSQSGGIVRGNILYRSGQLSNINDAGARDLDALGIKTLIDLRRNAERTAQPNKTPNINQISGNDEYDDASALPPHLQYLLDADLSAQKTRNFMLETYCRLPFEALHMDLFRQTFKTLMTTGTPLLIHCAAGKDRTGILCALILKALGVHDDDIMDDYLLTNKVVNLDEIIEKYAAKTSEKLGKNIDIAAMRPLGIVDAEYLDNCFKAIADKYGNWENYLSAIDINAQDIAKIRTLLLT